MQDHDYPNELISKVFFTSELLALIISGLVAAVGYFTADEAVTGILIVLAALTVPLAVVVFRLPAHLARSHPVGRLVVMVLVISVLGLILAYTGASTFLDLPPDVRDSPVTKCLRLGSLTGLVTFGLSFLANLVAIVYATSRSLTRPKR